jgi:hypothetical protein
MPAVDGPRAQPALTCPTCQGELRQVSQGTYGGARLHAELIVFECAQHGHVFLTREGLAGPAPGPNDDSGSPDAPALVPRNSPPAPMAGTVSIPLPDSN